MKYGMMIGALVALSVANPVFAEPAGVDNSFDIGSPGVHVMSGTRYKILKEGDPSGKRPARMSAVQVIYEVRTSDGKVIDSSKTAGRPDGSIIFSLFFAFPGWQAALLQMRPGDEWDVFVPPDLGGGDDHPLIIRTTLLDWAPIPKDMMPKPTMSELPGK